MTSNAPQSSHREAPQFGFAYAAFGFALVAMLGSLFFGEIMKLPPCTLCWYQRICLFPLTAVLAVCIALRDQRIGAYALPLVIAGLVISAYHNLLQLGVIDEALSPCTGGVSCSEQQIEFLGFATIPMMSLVAFLAILGSLVAHQRTQPKASE